jgi:hypothetical protein
MSDENKLFFKTEKERRVAFIQEYAERFSWLKEKMLKRYGLEEDDLLLVNFAATITDDLDESEDDIEMAKAFYCVAVDAEELQDMFFEMENMYIKYVSNDDPSFGIDDLNLN